MADTLMRETRHAVRRLVRAPAFTLASVLTLGLAIGANAAIFTVVERVVISPLPYRDADRILYLDHGARGLDLSRGLGLTSGLYWQYAQRSRMLRDVTLYQTAELTADFADGPANIQVTQTTPRFSAALGVAPAIGRWFDEEEGRPGGRPVAVLSHGFWQRRYDGDPGVLGRDLQMYGTTYEIIGVMPRGFGFPSTEIETWLPNQLDATVVRVGGFNYGGIARLADGVTLAQARIEMDGLIAQLPDDFPGDESARPMVEQARTFSHVLPLKEWVVGTSAGTLWILLGAVGVVLLVACANVANLFLVRTESRQQEVAVRQALGAGRGAIAGFFFAETFVLAIAGGALGFALAVGGLRALLAFAPELPRLDEVRIGLVAIAFTVGLSLLAGAVLGIVPLLRHRRRPGALLRETGRGNTVGRARLRGRDLLMGAQVALALVLLVASGLMAKSFQRMRAVDPGYDSANALVIRPGQLFTLDYPTREAAARFHESVLERVRAMPGVIGAAVTTCPPLSSYCHGDPASLPGRPWDADDMPPIVSFRRVGDEYFETMGIHLLRGRWFDERDQRVATRAIVIDDRMAELYFPGEDPLGQQVLAGADSDAPYEVVGVVNNVMTWGVRSTDRPPQIYMPLLSHTTENTPRIQSVAFIIRTERPPMYLVPAVRSAVAEIDPRVPLASVTTLDAMLASDRAPMAFTMTLIALASIVALVLGMVGIYGVISYVVAQRSSEIGVRLALGARPGDVARMVLRQGGGVAVAGLLIGLGVSAAGGRALSSMLYDVSPTDPRTYGLVTLVLLAVSLLACWLPARRAARLDPIVALRDE